jgi:hypothetical protein
MTPGIEVARVAPFRTPSRVSAPGVGPLDPNYGLEKESTAAVLAGVDMAAAPFGVCLDINKAATQNRRGR